MKTRFLMFLFLGLIAVGFAQDPVQRPGYGYRNEVDTSKHIINGFGITSLYWNGTTNAVINADSGDFATPYDISFKVNIADSNGNAAGNYVPHKQQTTALALKINKADSTGNAAGNYVTHKQQTTALALKLNVADSTGNAVGNYITHKQVSSTYSPIASPTFTGTLTVPTLKISTTDTTGTPVKGAIVFRTADSSFYGCRSTVAAHKWYKINP